MKLATHLSFVPKGGKSIPLGTNEFEFAVDRTARRILPRFLPSGARELVRIQGGRPFDWQGRVRLLDATAGRTHAINCSVKVEGTLPREEARCRTVLEAMLRVDLDVDRLLQRPIEETLEMERETLRGAFVRTLRVADDRDRLQGSLALSLRLTGLSISKVLIVPLSYDAREAPLELEDASGSFEIRSKVSLEAHRVAYKARLVWGGTVEQFLGRVAYDGTIMGHSPGSALSAPLVPGQIQPLEAYFRTLLAAALGEQPWSSMQAGDAGMIDAVRSTVSERLGRGTGRVVDTLVVYPVLETAPRASERSIRFKESYKVTGIRSEGLIIEHTVTFRQVDRDRWTAQRSPDPDAFFRDQVREATRVFLADKKFEDVVDLYLAADGEARLRDGIRGRLQTAAVAVGYALVSHAALLAIPEIDFIHGRQLSIPEKAYPLADPHLAPRMRVSVSVRIGEGGDRLGDLRRFARAISAQSDFEVRVQQTVEETVRRALRGFGALKYYASRYVNGDPTLADPSPRAALPVLRQDDDPLRDSLMNAVDAELKARFGLQLASFDIEPGEDPLIVRMSELSHASFQREIAWSFERVGGLARVSIHADATMFMVGLDPEHWGSFYNNAKRFSTVNDHVEEIWGRLTQTLRQLEPLLASGDLTGLRSRDWHERIIHTFARTVQADFGIVVRLRPLVLKVLRPQVGNIASLEYKAIIATIEKLYHSRYHDSDDSTFGDEEGRLKRIDNQIKAEKDKLASLSQAVEGDRETTEVVEIEQDLATGRIADSGSSARMLPRERSP